MAMVKAKSLNSLRRMSQTSPYIYIYVSVKRLFRGKTVDLRSGTASSNGDRSLDQQNYFVDHRFFFLHCYDLVSWQLHSGIC